MYKGYYCTSNDLILSSNNHYSFPQHEGIVVLVSTRLAAYFIIENTNNFQLPEIASKLNTSSEIMQNAPNKVMAEEVTKVPGNFAFYRVLPENVYLLVLFCGSKFLQDCPSEVHLYVGSFEYKN